MKKNITSILTLGLCVFMLWVVIFHFQKKPINSSNRLTIPQFEIKEERFSKETTQKGRAEYFFKMLRDPSIDQIPRDIYSKERQFVESLNLKRISINDPFDWKEVGPNDIGGRTRAVALDARNPDIILAGGVSGGMWKSIDGGETWSKKSDISDHVAVSALVQHPFNQDEWFYSTGEFYGSAWEIGAPFRGSGIFTSTDNGETWNQIESTKDDDIFYNSSFDYISNLTFSTTTGTSFFASNGFGIFRSTDDFIKNERVLGETNQQVWASVSVTKEGVVIAVLSSAFSGVTQTQSPGVYISTDDGLNWTDITPASFPSNPDRSAIGTSESDPHIFYVFTDAGAEELSLHRFDITDLNNIITSDRSSGIPDFGDIGTMNLYNGWNVVCKIHPTNPNMVIIGGTNLYRSTNGFNAIPPRDSEGITPTSEAPRYWIGGYGYESFLYPNHHPDNHNLIFDPTNPNIAISAHDGGLSRTEDITAEPVIWTDIDQGYNVTQFYKISIHPEADDARIMGGTQDNGSPYFSFDELGNSSNSEDVSSGDGATNYLGYNYLISSSQNGRLLKWNYEFSEYSFIKPSESEDQQFIHPFAVNPSDENYLFYPEFDHFWRNDQVISINSNSDGGTQGWSELDAINTGSSNHEISALTFSVNAPSDVLYYSGSDIVTRNQPPVIRRLDDLDATDGELDISIPDAEGGSYVNDIAVNPDNGNEVLAIMSNYNVKSIWHSSDGGNSWSDIEGNLGGENGPSIRSAAIAATDGSTTYYFVGTSVGLFFTDQINGENTVWSQTGSSVIENAVVMDLDYRKSDQILAVGTHGRGMFVGKVNTPVSIQEDPLVEAPSSFGLEQNFPNPFNPSTNIRFTIASNSRVSLTIFDISGREVAKILDQKDISAGSHTTTFDASALASGTYIYRIEAVPINGGAAFTQTKSMSLIK